MRPGNTHPSLGQNTRSGGRLLRKGEIAILPGFPCLQGKWISGKLMAYIIGIISCVKNIKTPLLVLVDKGKTL
jgi:hypothetical protein